MHFHLPKPLNGWREFVGEEGPKSSAFANQFGSCRKENSWRRGLELETSAEQARLGAFSKLSP